MLSRRVLWGVFMTMLTTTLANGVECKYTLDDKGEKHGEVRCFNAKGVLTDLQNWKHGKWHGAWKKWTDEGRLYQEESYDDQRQHGRFRDWDDKTGFPKTEGHYAFGQKVGEWRNYFDAAPGGRVYNITVYSQISKPDESSVEIGDSMYADEGRMTQQTKRDLKSGVTIREFFHSNGMRREHVEDNEKTKLWERRTYSETGKLARIERMKDGQTHGLQETLADNGHREVECYLAAQRRDSLAGCGGKTKLAADGSEIVRRTWEDAEPREEFRLVNGVREGE